MSKLSENMKSNNLIKALVLLLITTSIVTTFSISRFKEVGTDNAKTSVATFGIQSRGNVTADLILDPNTTTKSVNYTLRIQNKNDNGKISDVKTKFDVIIKLPKPLVSGLTMTFSGGTPIVSSDGLTYTYKDVGTFEAGAGIISSYQLKFTANYNSLIYNVYSGIKVSVYAEQVN